MEYMSQEGYDELVAELQHMVNVELPAVRDAIAEARDKGIRLHIVRDDTAGSTVCFGAFDGLLKVSRLISINTICFMSF